MIDVNYKEINNQLTKKEKDKLHFHKKRRIEKRNKKNREIQKGMRMMKL